MPLCLLPHPPTELAVGAADLLCVTPLPMSSSDRRFRFRLTVDFEVAVHSITEDSVHDLAATFSNRDEVVADPNTWAWVARQQRLLHALVSSPGLLRRYVEARAQGAAAEEAGGWVFEEMERSADRGGEEDGAFWGAVEMLREEDRAYFEATSDEGTLYESTTVFDSAFDAYPTGVTLEGID